MNWPTPGSFLDAATVPGPAPQAVPAPSPQGSAVLYDAHVRHVRTARQRYALDHRTYYWFVDVDALPCLPPLLRPLAGFDARDHFDGRGPTIRAGLERFLAGQRGEIPGGRVLMLRRAARIHKYIFPGGMLPSNEAIDEATRTHTGLRITDSTGFGPHYAETLRLWRERFTAHATDVAELGFDEAFRRMWTLYLAYSEAGFRSGYLDVRQILLTREKDA